MNNPKLISNSRKASAWLLRQVKRKKGGLHSGSRGKRAGGGCSPRSQPAALCTCRGRPNDLTRTHCMEWTAAQAWPGSVSSMMALESSAGDSRKTIVLVAAWSDRRQGSGRRSRCIHCSNGLTSYVSMPPGTWMMRPGASWGSSSRPPPLRDSWRQWSPALGRMSGSWTPELAQDD